MDSSTTTNSASSTAVLSRLMQMHARSMAVYLADARPWPGRNQQPAETLLRQIAEDHQYLVTVIGHRLLELGGSSTPIGSFPMGFTDLHDLSADYLLKQVGQQERELERLAGECVAQLQSDPESQALAHEANGMARGHRELLEELIG